MVATLIGHHPHLTACPRAPDRMAWCWRIVEADFPVSVIVAYRASRSHAVNLWTGRRPRAGLNRGLDALSIRVKCLGGSPLRSRCSRYRFSRTVRVADVPAQLSLGTAGLELMQHVDNSFRGGWPVLVARPARTIRDTCLGAWVTGSRPTYTRTSHTPGWRSLTVPMTVDRSVRLGML